MEFSETRRGYDPAQVDEFLERVGRGIGQLRQRLADAEARASATAGTDGAPQLHDPDRAVQRMLAAAQETADRVVHDAESDAVEVRRQAESHAVRVTAEAEQRAGKLVSDAEQQAARITSAAAAEARRVVEETRAPLVAEVESLKSAREELTADVERLEAHLADRRSALGEVVDQLRALVDGSPLVPPPAPETADVDPEVVETSIEVSEPEPSPVADEVADTTGETDVTPGASAGPAALGAVADEPARDDADTGSSEVLDLTDRDHDGESAQELLWAEEDTAAASPRRSAAHDDDASDDTRDGEVIRGAFAERLPDEGGDAPLDFYEADGDGTFGVDDDATGDTFLDELRRAVDDEDPLGRPDDEADRAMAAFFDQDDEEPKGRFRRR